MGLPCYPRGNYREVFSGGTPASLVSSCDHRAVDILRGPGLLDERAEDLPHYPHVRAPRAGPTTTPFLLRPIKGELLLISIYASEASRKAVLAADFEAQNQGHAGTRERDSGTGIAPARGTGGASPGSGDAPFLGVLCQQPIPFDPHGKSETNVRSVGRK